MSGRFTCRSCRRTFPLNTLLWQCPCGSPFSIETGSGFEPRRVDRRTSTIWRYRAAIPGPAGKNIVTLGEGGTPLVEVELGKRRVPIKQEQLMPTGSFKDRGASALVSHMKGSGIRQAVIDSSGNAAASVAAYSAAAGIACDVFIPYRTPAGKCAQIRAYGANLHQVRGTREETARAARKAAGHSFYASHYWHPLFIQGVKTIAYEIFEQLGGRAPDAIVLPCGNGTLVLGAYLGFQDLATARLIPRLPRIIAVQSVACAPLYRAYQRFSRRAPWRPTRAEGIAIAEPIRAEEIIAAVRETRGSVIAVTEREIARALRLTADRGFFIEPTAATAVAGLIRYLPGSRKKEVVVSVFTGHGLKTALKIAGIMDG